MVIGWSVVEVCGTNRVAVKCVEPIQNSRGEGGILDNTDDER